MLSIEDQRVTIIGARRSGLAAARLVIALKGKPRISESGSEDCLFDHQRPWKIREKIDVEFGGHTQEFIAQSDIVVVSPGVPIDSKPVQWAKSLGVPVMGEIEFAFQFCERPVIAVTGSNGKTTVSTLIDQVLKSGGYKSCLCGNIGYPFSDYVLDLDDKDFVVLELSSFQLESLLSMQEKEKFPISGFKPHIGLLINFSQNHLDRHEDLEEYFDAKKRMFMNQDKDDFAVLNGANDALRVLGKTLTAHVKYFGSTVQTEQQDRIDPNHLAVLEVAKILAIDPKVCYKVFKEFKGVEHRMEWVDRIDGVDYINDSKATTAEASRWALEHIYQPIIMICGGRDKNIDFTVLRNIVKQKVKKVIAIGESSKKIQDAFGDLIDVQICDSMETAVKKSQELSQEGDCVVLSPMCASFDMFSNFEERGEVYKQIVRQLKPAEKIH